VATEQEVGLIVSRLCKTLDDEKATLHSRDYKALDVICEQKVRCLVELNRISSSAGSEDHASLRNLLDQARQALQENELLLRIHVQAVGAVSAMLKDVIEEEASDGTYSARSTKTRAP
jgi:flagellar biosynthesis/type III secretory pathway chaperone